MAGPKRKSKKTFIPTEKDDGTRWIVVRNGEPVYPGTGIPKQQAIRLATGLVEEAGIQQVEVEH